jgi:L,D-peptidoglycan transpeptidase YkuD (ErfK/YbiS/YcfS/YnhG family)
LPLRAISRNDGWCDEACDRNYNRSVRLPYRAHCEEMWRADGLYDLVVVVGYNDAPRIRGKGSAIFIHVAREGFKPTEGCVALTRADLIRLAARLNRATRLVTDL